MHALLAGAGLPLSGLDSAWATIVALDGEDVVGAAALERHGPPNGPAFLLRSVVVAPTHRSTGVGLALVTEAVAAADDAVEAGTATVGPLTETADGYFHRFRVPTGGTGGTTSRARSLHGARRRVPGLGAGVPPRLIG